MRHAHRAHCWKRTLLAAQTLSVAPTFSKAHRRLFFFSYTACAALNAVYALCAPCTRVPRRESCSSDSKSRLLPPFARRRSPPPRVPMHTSGILVLPSSRRAAAGEGSRWPPSSRCSPSPCLSFTKILLSCSSKRWQLLPFCNCSPSTSRLPSAATNYCAPRHAIDESCCSTIAISSLLCQFGNSSLAATT